MATGYLDANGIWQYGEDDSDSNFSTLLNRLASSTSDVVANPTVSGNMRLTNSSDVSLTSTNHAFQIGASASTNLRMDNNEVMAVNNGAATTLFIQNDGGDLTLGNSSSTITVGGRFNATHYPYAVATGSVTTSTSAHVTVTFPAGRFTVGPNVSVTSVAGANAVCTPYVATVNSSAMTVSLYTTAGARVAQQVQWLAIQM